jgi:hypothetical protein
MADKLHESEDICNSVEQNMHAKENPVAVLLSRTK